MAHLMKSGRSLSTLLLTSGLAFRAGALAVVAVFLGLAVWGGW